MYRSNTTHANKEHIPTYILYLLLSPPDLSVSRVVCLFVCSPSIPLVCFAGSKSSGETKTKKVSQSAICTCLPASLAYLIVCLVVFPICSRRDAFIGCARLGGRRWMLHHTVVTCDDG
jgi:hypothetical protein